jgi:hypothetical protein
VADAILRSRKTVSVYSDYFYLVVSCERETGIVKCFVHFFVVSPAINFIVGCDPVTELMTFHSTSSTVQKCGFWLRKYQF